METFIDFSQTKQLEPLEGTFEAVLTEHKVGASKAGNAKADFIFTITEPELEGRKVYCSKSLLAQSLWSVKSWYVNLGANPEDLNTPRALPAFNEWVNEQIVGNPCRVKCSVGSYVDANGETKPSQQVDAVLSASVY